jgi:hypothetical protein
LASASTVTSKLLTLPQTGQENKDHNPDRVKPRDLIDFGVGTDNLLHAEGPRRILLLLTVANLTNQVALYNFLSTFSGTHFCGAAHGAGVVGIRVLRQPKAYWRWPCLCHRQEHLEARGPALSGDLRESGPPIARTPVVVNNISLE